MNLAEPGSFERRGIRSFVLREGRLTRAQRRAIETCWQVYGLEAAGVFDLDAAFGRCAPVTLEIGFGTGENLLSMALAEPQNNFLGVEVHRPGIGRLLQGAASAGVSNLKLVRADAVPVMRDHIADGVLARVLILFPDPWPKHRHHKRRLLTPAFVVTLAAKISRGGILHLATDWQDYAEVMRGLVAASGYFGAVGDGSRPRWRAETRFETRGSSAGRKVTNLLYRRF